MVRRARPADPAAYGTHAATAGPPAPPPGRQVASDRFASGWMDPLQVFVVDELGTSVRSRLEIERAPRNHRRFMGKTGEVHVGFGMELRHSRIVALVSQRLRACVC